MRLFLPSSNACSRERLISPTVTRCKFRAFDPCEGKGYARSGASEGVPEVRLPRWPTWGGGVSDFHPMRPNKIGAMHRPRASHEAMPLSVHVMASSVSVCERHARRSGGGWLSWWRGLRRNLCRRMDQHSTRLCRSVLRKSVCGRCGEVPTVLLDTGQLAWWFESLRTTLLQR